MINTITKMLNTTRQSYYNWKDTKPIIPFLEKYFKQDDLEEYLATNQIKRLELIKNIDTSTLEKLITEYEVRRLKELDEEFKLLEEIDSIEQNIDARHFYDILNDIQKDVKELKEK